MASATPGGAPGYDEKKEVGNNITHEGLGLPKGCAEHSGQTRKVKAKPARSTGFELSAVAGVRPADIAGRLAVSSRPEEQAPASQVLRKPANSAAGAFDD